MTEKLIIWITNPDALTARWLVLDARGNRIGFPQQGQIDEAAQLAPHRRVVILLPGEHILSASARVPGRNPQRILQAAPYALEEKLAGDVEKLHVALLERHADQQCDFIVTERGWLAGLLERFSDAGLRAHAVWPDYLGVPNADAIEYWLLTGDERLLGRKRWRGFAAPASDAGLLYAHRAKDEPLQLAVVGDRSPPALEELETVRLADNERAFTEMAATAAALPGAGLLQGRFRRRSEHAANWKRWQWTAAAAIAWLMIAATAFGLDLYQLQREHDLLERTSAELFQQALPGARLVRGEERHRIEQALRTGGAVESQLLDYLADVSASLQNVSNAQLNAFNYRNQRMELSVTVPNAQALDRFRSELAQKAQERVDVQSANSTPGGLEGRLLLTGERE